MTNGNDPINMDTTEFGTMGGQYGLTKREYFAATALQGLMASLTEKASFGALGTELDEIAKSSVEQADALIKALNEKP